MPSLRNSGQNTFFPKQAKLSESFSCTYSFQILCLEFQTPVFGIPNIMHSCMFGINIPNMHVWNFKHVVRRARFARAQIPNSPSATCLGLSRALEESQIQQRTIRPRKFRIVLLRASLRTNSCVTSILVRMVV